MLANEKKTLLQLKTDFDENAPLRITPKLLRDFLVSSYGSRGVNQITDSVELTEDDDLIVAMPTDGTSYFRVPKSFEVDESGTPFENKFYTIVNPSSYPIRIITFEDDTFHTGVQEIVLNPAMVGNVFSFNSKWYYFVSGVTSGDTETVGFPIRTETEVYSLLETPIDVFVSEVNRTVKWTVSMTDEMGMVRVVDLCGIMKLVGESIISQTFSMGDEVESLTFEAIYEDGSFKLIATHTHASVVTFVVMRTIIS